jgi:hypothetical protein
MIAGVFPSIWKTVSIQPVPKKGDKSDPLNYRPIAIVSVLSKVMDINFNNHQLQLQAHEHTLEPIFARTELYKSTFIFSNHDAVEWTGQFIVSIKLQSAGIQIEN